MAKLDGKDLAPEIQVVLERAHRGDFGEFGFLTAYQILNRLSVSLQDFLREAYGRSGEGAGNHFSPATRVAQVTASLENVEKADFDTRGLQFELPHDEQADAGGDVCAIFRLKAASQRTGR
jgi:hypothetical protein